ncbi:PDR/VanB family oxidoreductase [Paraburkholderia domus]|uniref:PDR/VanB family oxidoreductase n=1 Tax=Paraburkholderia domus TaxID=2793075 RepID=UPI001F2F5D16|nr:PDR/VanB family oxidoreductase [Paraburkholderia domus]
MDLQEASVASSLQVVVAKKESIADGVMHFELRSAAGSPLPAYTAGSHVDVTLPNGAIRQYSLCNAPASHASDRYEIAVLLDPEGRGGSRSAHFELMQGAEVRISPPRNHFPLTQARHTILLAGGIGVTPILSMAYHLDKTDASFEMHYCTRSAARTAFIQQIKASKFTSRVAFYHDDSADSGRFDALHVLGRPSIDTHLYVCGPNGFMDYAITTARASGWVEQNIHREHFAAPPIDQSRDGPFTVQIASTGQTVPVPAGQTVVQALSHHGIEVPVSCEQGICGTCVMRVLEGIPDHRDAFFGDEQRDGNDRFTPCCSRAKSSILVIDF